MAKSTAPTAGPASWLSPTNPNISRVLARASSVVGTIIGSSVDAVVSVTVSLSPIRKSATMCQRGSRAALSPIPEVPPVISAR